ncbi:hypothetical protein BH10ACI3_BH10ACI3_14350 [soil metagenome]
MLNSHLLSPSDQSTRFGGGSPSGREPLFYCQVRVNKGINKRAVFPRPSYPDTQLCEETPDLAAVLTEDKASVRPGNAEADAPRAPKSVPAVTEDDIVCELGIWLSGVESFLASGHHTFAGIRDAGGLADASKEFRLVHSTLQRCSMLAGTLLSSYAGKAGPSAAITWEITYGDLSELASFLREAILLSDGLIRSESLGSGEWRAWSGLLAFRFRSLSAFAKLIRFAEGAGEKYLPKTLNDLAASEGFLSPDHAELALILPRFGRVLKWLSVIGRMLEADEPLKPALLIFARVNEQILELTSYINNRLERFPNEEAELFSSLDAASYTASIELKKVYTQELAGLARMQQSPSVYARMETAHSLLNESFQQTLAGFARLIDPRAEVFTLFPNFELKREQSIVLRDELSRAVAVVQVAEKEQEKKNIEPLHTTLREFMKGSARYLFYKDSETVERFVEEILVTKQNKDLVPILHRFGAYLETLFGQVSLRAVLEKHPFEVQNGSQQG